MTKAEVICNLIVMAISLIVATAFLSDVVRERRMEYRNFKTVISLILAGYSSLGLALLTEIYYSAEFKMWRIFIVGFSIFCAYFVASCFWGLYKAKKDEEERWNEKMKHIFN